MSDEKHPVNPYAETTAFLLNGVHEWQSEEGSTDATNLAAALDAVANASLALAYEQRTANLIALYADGAAGPVTGVNYSGLVNQIITRLGLTPSSTKQGAPA